MNTAPTFISASEAAHHLGITSHAVRGAVRAGRLPAIRLGRTIRIPRWAVGLAEPAPDLTALDVARILSIPPQSAKALLKSSPLSPGIRLSARQTFVDRALFDEWLRTEVMASVARLDGDVIASLDVSPQIARWLVGDLTVVA
jgi:excisionase family DNA binding protein